MRISCCRLVTSSVSSKRGPTVQLCLLPTEHVAVLVDATEAKEMEDRYSLSFSLSLSLSLSLFDTIHNTGFQVTSHMQV